MERESPSVCNEHFSKPGDRRPNGLRLGQGERNRTRLAELRRGRTSPAHPAPRRLRLGRDVRTERRCPGHRSSRHRCRSPEPRPFARDRPPDALRDDGRRHRGPDRAAGARARGPHGLLARWRGGLAHGNPASGCGASCGPRVDGLQARRLASRDGCRDGRDGSRGRGTHEADPDVRGLPTSRATGRGLADPRHAADQADEPGLRLDRRGS